MSRAHRTAARLVQRLGVVPSYYLHYFYDHDAVVEEQRHGKSRAEDVSEIERRAAAPYADETLDEKPELLKQRGGAGYSEAAVELMRACSARRRGRT